LLSTASKSKLVEQVTNFALQSSFAEHLPCSAKLSKKGLKPIVQLGVFASKNKSKLSNQLFLQMLLTRYFTVYTFRE